jgi:hypothetical protein
MSDFQDQWAPTWEVQKTVPGAQTCVIETTSKTFKTGRPVVQAVFYDARRREICRRSGMRLQSRKGTSYEVCRREAEEVAVESPAASATIGPEDIFED